MAWGAALFLGARTAVRSNTSLQRQAIRFALLAAASSELKACFVDAETDQRDFLLTGDEAFHDGYDAARDRAAAALARVRALTQPWPQLAPLVAGVADAWAGWQEQARREIRARLRYGLSAAIFLVDRGAGLRRFAELRAR